MTPRLSIITACFNHAHFLTECIASVQAQTFPDYEHIIIDDASTDGSLAVAEAAAAKDSRIRVLRNEVNRGLGATQNLGVANARAPWVLKLDADDRARPRYVAEILNMRVQRPAANVIFSPAYCFGGPQGNRVYRYPLFDPKRMIDVFMIPGPAALPVALWNAVGGLDESIVGAEDWDFWVRAQLVVGLRPVQLRDAHWEYREHAGPRLSTEGMKRLGEHQRRMRGYTRETAILNRVAVA